MKVDVPFYSNTQDNTHCYQAALKMVLKYFKPNEEYSWEQLDQITAKVKDLWTWPTASMIWLNEKGFELIDIEIFDWDKFSKQGESYLIDFYGEEVAKEQIKHGDIEQEKKLARNLVERIKIQNRLPSIDDIKELLSKGYLIIALINSSKINQKDGYTGHFVVIKSFDENNLVINDPGLPPLENREVSYELFIQSWAYPYENAKNLLAIKL